MKSLFLVSFLLSASLVRAFDVFNCLRDGQSCGPGTCVGGSCSCSALNRFGYKCQDDLGRGSICGANCITCLSGDECLCSASKYNGPDNECEQNRLQMICSIPNKMILNANLEGANTVFVKDHPSCTLQGTAGANNLPSYWQGFMREITSPDDDATCGAPNVYANMDGTSSRCMTVLVRYGTDYWTSLDSEIEFCCRGSQVQIVGADLETSSLLAQRITISPPAGAAGDIDVTVLLGNTPIAMGEVVNLGDPISLQFELATDAPFIGLKLITCNLQEAASGNSQSNEIVSTGCPTGFAGSLLAPTATGYSLTFQVIRYVGFDDLYVVCDVRLCTTSAACVHTCGGGVGRKKRETPTNSTGETLRKVSFPFRVRSPLEENSEEAVVDNAVTKATNINLSAAVIGLAVVVLVLLAACLLLGVCLVNKRRAPDPKA